MATRRKELKKALVKEPKREYLGDILYASERGGGHGRTLDKGLRATVRHGDLRGMKV